MTDLTSVDEFFLGDPLLRADRLMAASLDGVYPRGPFYLRWLQKVSSLAYGLPWGRGISRYVALPFGLAFLLLKTIDVAIEHMPFARKLNLTPVEVDVPHVTSHFEATDTSSVSDVVPPVVENAHHHVDVIYSHRAMLLLGLVIFALIHFPAFRRSVVSLLTTAWTALRIIVMDAPRAILRWKLVDMMFKSFPMMLFRRFILAPVTATVIFWWLLPGLGIYPEMNRWWGLAIFLACYLILNSRIGRDTEELAREFFARTWYRIRVHLVMGLFTLIIDIFNALMDGLERLLYAVDEWSRFRSGESNLTLGVKAVFGLIWSFVHGVIRFCVTLLIEPQVNPIKHFPVVTVSHKLVITTLTVPIASVLQTIFDKPTAFTVTFLILTSIPGVFGFLAWELKENWRLYRANRSRKLKPVLIGDHGETLLRLLCPGFHSGTIPRLFAKLRRAARRDATVPASNKRTKFATRLQHESTAVRHFIEREFVSLLHESKTFCDASIVVGEVVLTTNQVLVTIQNAELPHPPLKLEFTEQSGWLVGAVREMGWLAHVGPERRDVVKAAISGLYKLAAVDLVREQFEPQLALAVSPTKAGSALLPEQQKVCYDIGDQGLIIWPNATYETEVYYPLDELPVSNPRPRSLARACGLSPKPLDSLVFRLHEITWEEWKQYWDSEQTASAGSPPHLPMVW